MDAQAEGASAPDERTARRWAVIALVSAIAGAVAAVVALGTGVGVLLAIVGVVLAVWVRLGMAPYARRQTTIALWVSALTLAAHFVLYTALLVL